MRADIDIKTEEEMQNKTYKNLIDKIQNTSFTEKDVLLNFFMPIYKLSGNSTIYKNFKSNGNKLIIENEYGKVEIRNRILTEFHLKIFDAIVFCGTASILKDKRVGIFYEESDVLEYLHMKNNTTKFREIVKQIADARYYIDVEDYSYSIGIIDKYYKKNETANSKNLIILDPDYVKSQKLNFGVNYKMIHDRISNIKYHTIPSIVRYIMLKNKSSNTRRYELTEILTNIGFPVSSKSSMKEIKQNLKNYSEELRNNFGIIYNSKNKTFDYAKMQQIEFVNFEPEKELRKLNGKTFIYKSKHYKIISIDGESGNWIINTDSGELNFSLFYDDLIEYIKKNLAEEGSQSLLDI